VAARRICFSVGQLKNHKGRPVNHRGALFIFQIKCSGRSVPRISEGCGHRLNPRRRYPAKNPHCTITLKVPVRVIPEDIAVTVTV
jgi:hypothetical protein